jgi:hypothetical protein
VPVYTWLLIFKCLFPSMNLNSAEMSDEGTHFNPLRIKVTLRPTVNRPVYLGVKPHLGPKTRFLLLSVAGLMMWAALSNLPFTVAAGPRQRSQSLVRVPLMTIFYCLRFETPPLPNLEGHVPVFKPPRNKVAKLYSQAPGSLSVAFYDSRGFGGGIRTHRIPSE